MEILIDACAIMTVIVKEPERDLVIRLTQNAVMVSPIMMPYEIANALTKMMKKKIIEKERTIKAFNYFKTIPIKTIEIDIEKALEIAWGFKIYAYDACYLEAAKRLKLPLKNVDAKGRSPFEDIHYITADITTREIVELIKETRSGVALLLGRQLIKQGRKSMKMRTGVFLRVPAR
ncbi:MAG: type II toxin-antitoxin system VapC family toxin [Chitinispirillales bacterium]|jgi:predicted nucleic acid-binding protein|nr:type II toxin-antitoxin system VapC family toxin [Chitinispirillales bacterium]